MERAYSAPRRRVNGIDRHNCQSRKSLQECDSGDTGALPESNVFAGPVMLPAERRVAEIAKFYCARSRVYPRSRI